MRSFLDLSCAVCLDIINDKKFILATNRNQHSDVLLTFIGMLTFNEKSVALFNKGSSLPYHELHLTVMHISVSLWSQANSNPKDQLIQSPTGPWSN